MLAAPDLDKKIRIKVNTLDYTTEGVLFMECNDRKWRPVMFFSKSLNEIEKNYKIHNKKTLVVIRDLFRKLEIFIREHKIQV